MLECPQTADLAFSERNFALFCISKLKISMLCVREVAPTFILARDARGHATALQARAVVGRCAAERRQVVTAAPSDESARVAAVPGRREGMQRGRQGGRRGEAVERGAVVFERSAASDSAVSIEGSSPQLVSERESIHGEECGREAK